jgi:hypothetical protein
MLLFPWKVRVGETIRRNWLDRILQIERTHGKIFRRKLSPQISCKIPTHRTGPNWFGRELSSGRRELSGICPNLIDLGGIELLAAGIEILEVEILHHLDPIVEFCIVEAKQLERERGFGRTSHWGSKGLFAERYRCRRSSACSFPDVAKNTDAPPREPAASTTPQPWQTRRSPRSSWWCRGRRPCWGTRDSRDGRQHRGRGWAASWLMHSRVARGAAALGEKMS